MILCIVPSPLVGHFCKRDIRYQNQGVLTEDPKLTATHCNILQHTVIHYRALCQKDFKH